MARSLILIAALGFIVLLSALTGVEASRNGVDILVVVSFVVLALFLFGILGALFNPPKGPDA
jgi:high-affinity Fe2+/Pb2+ permease